MSRPTNRQKLLAAILHNHAVEASEAAVLAGVDDTKENLRHIREHAALLREGKSKASSALILTETEEAGRILRRRTATPTKAPPSPSPVASAALAGLPLDEGDVDYADMEPVPYWRHEVRRLHRLASASQGATGRAYTKEAHDARKELDAARERDAALKAARDVRQLTRPADLLRILGAHVRALAATAPAELRVFVNLGIAALPPEPTP